jgi:alkanesulfonate monooxygenase SsuD/methylene tetrahydromethanopterin reductase-like flavin-dependent oxidoreductase (luciferase family)
MPFVSPDELAAVKRKVGDRLPVSTMTGCIVGETRDDALDRARTLYDRVPRGVDFDTWLERYGARAIIGSVDEARARLHEYEAAGAERVMLQHLLHTDLEPVRLIGERLRPA